MKKGNRFKRDNFDPVMMSLLLLVLIGLGVVMTLVASGVIQLARLW